MCVLQVTTVQREQDTDFLIPVLLDSTANCLPQCLCRTAVCVSLDIFVMFLAWQIQKFVQK